MSENSKKKAPHNLIVPSLYIRVLPDNRAQLSQDIQFTMTVKQQIHSGLQVFLL